MRVSPGVHVLSLILRVLLKRLLGPVSSRFQAVIDVRCIEYVVVGQLSPDDCLLQKRINFFLKPDQLENLTSLTSNRPASLKSGHLSAWTRTEELNLPVCLLARPLLRIVKARKAHRKYEGYTKRSV